MLHEKLRCYKRSIELSEEISKEVARWPRGYSYLIDQMKRAMASVVLNMAKGNTRRSNTERRRFFEISRASCAEVSACIDLIKAFNLSPQSKTEAFKTTLTEISKMLWGLMR